VIPQRGVYTVGNRQFFNKVPALQYATETESQVTWSYGDEYFSQFDWETEPTESLSQLYIDRCQQLRDDYDYLILYYSGGSDSHNILTHFIKSGIHIDEVVSFYPIEYYEKKHGANLSTDKKEMQNEWYYTGLPDFKNLTKLIPNTKLTLLDYTRDCVNLDIPDDWQDIVGEVLHANIAKRTSIFKDKNLLLQSEKGKVALIHGIDKPRVFTVNGDWYFAFLDLIAGLTPALPRSLLNSGAVTEHFYWSDKSVKMLIKQAHAVKKFWLSNSTTFPPPQQKKISFEIRQIYDNITRSIVYPYWRKEIFQIDKPTSLWFNDTEIWIFDESKKVSTFWNDFYMQLTSSIDKKYMQSSLENKNPDGFVGFWSKWHKI